MATKGKYVVTVKKIVAISRLFQHGKTQIPKEIREALKIEDGDKIVWLFEGQQCVVKNTEEHF